MKFVNRFYTKKIGKYQKHCISIKLWLRIISIMFSSDLTEVVLNINMV